MKQSILIVISGALASLLAIPQAAAFPARSAHTQSDFRRESDEIRQSFKLAPGTRVEISSIRGPVEIETSGSDTAEILIRRTGDNLADLQSDKILIDNQAGRLIIRGETVPGGNKNRHVNHYATLKLPRDLNVAMNSISGSVQLADLNGQFEVSSVSGSVTLDKVTQQARFKSISGDVKIGQVGGPLDIASVSGSVKLDQVAHGANIQSVSGDVRINQVTDSIDISSVSGNVSLVIAKLGTGGVHITSVSREVELRFRNEVDAQFTANSISRDVSIDLPNVTIDDKSANSTRARIGAGGPTISVNSVSGGVRLMLDTQTRSQE